MSDSRPESVVKQSASIEYEAVGAADGVSKGALVSKAGDAPNFAVRRFILDPGASVLKHTNEVKHEQCALSGHRVVGIGDEECEVEVGNSLLIPVGVAHWYRDESDTEEAFLCTAPNGNGVVELATDTNA